MHNSNFIIGRKTKNTKRTPKLLYVMPQKSCLAVDRKFVCIGSASLDLRGRRPRQTDAGVDGRNQASYRMACFSFFFLFPLLPSRGGRAAPPEAMALTMFARSCIVGAEVEEEGFYAVLDSVGGHRGVCFRDVFAELAGFLVGRGVDVGEEAQWEAARLAHLAMDPPGGCDQRVARLERPIPHGGAAAEELALGEAVVEGVDG